MNDSTKLDLVLVNVPSPHPGSVLSHRLQGMPPLGVGYLAQWIINKGYRVKIIDLYIDELTIIDLLEVILVHNPMVIGLSTTTETFNTAVMLASICKKIKNDIVIIMGGSHVTFEYEAALKTGVVDVVVRHEGEQVLENLCKYYIDKKGTLYDIRGISFINSENVIVKNIREKFIENLDLLPIINRELFDMHSYPIPGVISSSRGCPGKCIFCAASALSGGRYRIRSASSIIEEFIYLKNLGVNYVQIVDDTMTADLDRLYEFLETMIKLNLGVVWGCESRVDVITKDLLLLLKKSGCVSLQFGVESGNQGMLDCLKKDITIEQIRNAFLWCKELGIKTGTCLMIGQPFETKKSIKDTITLSQELQSYGAKVIYSVTTPFPGTSLYNNPDKYGMKIKNWDFDYYNTFTPVYDTINFKRDDIQRLYYDSLIDLGRSLKDEDRIEELRRWSEHVMEKVGLKVETISNKNK